jgi:hypothetical protein
MCTAMSMNVSEFVWQTAIGMGPRTRLWLSWFTGSAGYLIIRYPNNEAADKHWDESVSKWWNDAGHKYADFRAIGVEGVEQK